MSVLCFSVIAFSQGSITEVYSTGNISTSFGAYDPTCNGPLTTVTVTLPVGGPWVVTDVETAYNMLATGGAWMSEQQSQLHCQNTLTTEATVFQGTGTGGTFNYARTGVDIANGTYPGGTVLTFEMRAWRTWGGSACDQIFNYVVNNTWSVTVNFTLETPPTPLQDPAAPTCATGTDLSVPGTPDPGIDWYWQTTAGGTSTANLVSGPYTVFTNGTYYVRAYDAVNDIWSAGASSVTVVNMPTAPAPPAPVADQNPVCVPGTNLTVPAAPGGIEYYWQGTNEFGSSQADPATAPYAVGTTGTYYVTAYDIASQCWSDGVGTLVTVNSDIPAMPTPVQSTYVYCSIDNPMDIEVVDAPVGCPIDVNVFSASWGDGTTWTVTDNDGATVLSGGTYGNGYNDLQSIPSADNGPYTLTLISAFGDNSPSYTVSVDGNVVFSGTAPASQTTNIGPFSCPAPVITPMWYSASTGGDFLGSGLTLNALGTTVLPTGVAGTYEFYVANDMGGCESARELVEVIVSEVSVDLTAIDESCTAYGDGSFTLANVNCGTAPFLYSIDGGAFGAIPTDLSAGTYSVIVQDAMMLESAPIPVTVGTASTVIPDAPAAVQSIYNYCVDSDPMEIEVEVLPSGCPIEVNVFSASWGDGTTWTVTDNDGATVLSGGTYGNGYNDLQTIPLADNGPYTLNLTSTLGDNSPSYSVSVDGNVVFSGTAPASQTTNIGPFSCPVGGAIPEWYSAVTGGDFLGDQPVLNALGTTVIPVGAEGTYEFYAYNNLNGCYSVDATIVTVNLSTVLVNLDPMDETCTGYANGSFTVSGVECGTAPFMYSIDGGAFGGIPTDLTAGTYSVVVQDANLEESAPITLVIGTTSSVIPDSPVVTDSILYACSGDLSVLAEAEVPFATGSLTTTFAAGNGCGNGNMFDITTNTSPVNIEAFDVNSAGAGNANVYYVAGGYVGNEANAGAWTLVGTYAVPGAGVQNIDVADFTIPAGTTYGIYVDYNADYTNLSTTYSDAYITITTGSGFCTAFSGPITGRTFNGTVYYSAGLPAAIEWYDAPSISSNNIGSGSPLETVGTSVLPTTTVGTYEFYAYAELDGCYSVNPSLVTVNVSNVNVTLDPIDADCNNAPTGSFILNTVECGTPPFMYSVDGGAFGPIPSDLTPGTYSIVAQDFNMDQSAEYFVVVGEAGAPSDSYMADITDNGGQVSWNSNGTETEWNVEWGLPGFTPGTGTEIGSATATDTFAIITGLDGNTNYDVYVSANCGAGTTTGSWDMVNWTTDCGIYSIPFIETFEDDSETRVCWQNIQEVGAADWTYQTGAGGGTVLTAYEGLLNARFVSVPGTDDPITKLESPRFDFTGQDSVAVIFAYAQEEWAGDQNTTKVYTFGPAATWTEVASYTTNVNAWTVDTIFIADTTEKIAFEGINNWGRANVIDYVQVLPCNLNPGVDGAADVCRLDGTFDVNTIVTVGEDFGTWSFPSNPGVLNGSVVSVSALPSGTFDFYYIVKTPCAEDTTVATLTIYPPSTAGNDGTITACMNEPINLLSGLTGTVDLGGQWYDPMNNLTSVSITASNIPGSFNYDYITTNGICPNDTSNIVLTVLSTCDYLDIQELVFGDMNVYPNPTDGLVFVSSTGNAEVFNYELTDVNGRVISVKEAAINGTETAEISLEKLEPGIYMIRVYNASAEKTFRVVKQ